MQPLHTYHDGSVLGRLSARALLLIPIWKGNRIIDAAHIRTIRESVGDKIQHLDSGYRIICYNEEDANGAAVTQRYIIDGQHRLSVLREYFAATLCAPDFPVTVTEITVDTETEAIDYFNRINTAKPIHFAEDPVLVMNRYVAKMQELFQGRRKMQLLRSVATHRPFLHVDRLRDALSANYDALIRVSVADFGVRLAAKNTAILRELELMLAVGGPVRDEKIAQRCLELGFGLAFDPKLRWVTEIL